MKDYMFWNINTLLKSKKKKKTQDFAVIIGYQSPADMDASRMIWESSKSRLGPEGSSRKDATN